MSNTVPKSKKAMLNPRDVCSIIETCAKNGVSELQFGELSFRLGPPQPAPPWAAADTEISDAKLKQEAETYLVQQELKTQDDDIDQMFIEDPYGAEELMVRKGEFDGDRSGTDDTSEEQET